MNESKLLDLMIEVTHRTTGADPRPVADALQVEGLLMPAPTQQILRDWLDRIVLPRQCRHLVPRLRTLQSRLPQISAPIWHAARNLVDSTRGHVGPGMSPTEWLGKDRLVFAVDLDQTCYDWLGPFTQRAAQRLGVDPATLLGTGTYDPFLSWGLDWDAFSELNREMILDGTAFTVGDMIEGAAAGVAALQDAGHSVISITARGSEGLEAQTRDATFDWLNNVGIRFDAVHFTSDKNSVFHDVLVDDSPHNVTHAVEANRVPIVFSHSWNHQISPMASRYRAFGWDNVLRHAGVQEVGHA